jgi:hypothetical protein
VNNTNTTNTANQAAYRDETLFGAVYESETAQVAKGNNNNVWYLDSGASCHMTHNKDTFHTLEKRNFPGSIITANNAALPIMGKGMTKIDLNIPVKIEDVCYVPGLSSNLLSVGEMTKKGNEILFKDDKCMIYNNS